MSVSPTAASSAPIAASAATLAALREAYACAALDPRALVEHWLSRPEAERATPVWIATVTPAKLRAHADSLAALLTDDRAGALALPLFGALFAVKDNIDVAGMPTTVGCPAFTYHPERSATVVELLEAAGAMLVGKTNLDQFATGLVGTRSPFGAVPNAFDPTMIAGGSSSGSAVAVALGQVHFSLGTDTAGSGRVPAALNNLVGWKPTRGLVSTRGVFPACRSLDCVSIMALTVGDAARVFAVLEQTEAQTADSRRPAPKTPCGAPSFTFAVPAPAQRDFDGDASSAAAFAAAIERLQALGGVALNIDFAPWAAVGSTLYDGPRVAERHAAIRDFFDARPDALDPTVRQVIAGAAAFSATDVFVAEAELARAGAALSALWRDVDVLVLPTVPTAYRIADVEADPLALNRRLGTYTNFVNLLDLAALAVPAALKADGIPFGITFIGPAGSDLRLAQLGQRFHASTGLTLGALGLPMPRPESLPEGPPRTLLAVVGAHLSGLPLNRELTSRGARLVRRALTASCYELYALPGTMPPKPGLVRTCDGARHSIEIEVWEMPVAAFGSFVAGIPSPLALGTLKLEDGSSVQGFLCEAAGTCGAEDISRFGGWRNYVKANVFA